MSEEKNNAGISSFLLIVMTILAGFLLSGVVLGLISDNFAKAFRDMGPTFNIFLLILLCVGTFFIICKVAKGIKVMFEKILQRYQHFSHTEKIFRCITIIAEVLLLLALCNRFEYGFYTFLRFVVCAAFVGLVINQRVPPLVKVFTIMGAILYNPIVPVHIGDRDVWCVINVLSIPLFIIGECFVYLNEKKD